MAKKTTKPIKKKTVTYSNDDEEMYPSEEQGILPEESSDDITDDIRKGDKEGDVYSKEGRDELEEDDEMEVWEEGFMDGAEGGGQLAKDALTGEPLPDDEDEITELVLKGKVYRFVSEANAKKFKKKHQASN